MKLANKTSKLKSRSKDTIKGHSKILHEKMKEAERIALSNGYTDVIPKLPKNPTSNTMAGFNKRFNNWKRKYEHFLKEKKERVQC